MLRVNQLNGFGARRDSGVTYTPVFESLTITESTATSHTVNMPTTRPDGDLYVCVFATDRADTTPTVDAGWTLITLIGDDANNYSGGGAYWWIGDSEPATYTVGTENGATDFGIFRYSGADPVKPIEGFAWEKNPSSSTTYDCPAVTSVTGTAQVIRAIFPYRVDASSIGTGTFQAGGDYYGFATDDGPAPAGTTGTATFTLSDRGNNNGNPTITIVIGSLSGLPTPDYTDDYLVWLDATYTTTKVTTNTLGNTSNNFQYLEDNSTAAAQSAWGRPSRFTYDSRVDKAIGMSYPDNTVRTAQDGNYVAVEWTFQGSWPSYVSVTLNTLTSTAFGTFDGGKIAKLVYFDPDDPTADLFTGAVTITDPV